MNESKKQTSALSIIAAVAYIFISVPLFSMTGDLIKPVFLAVTLGALVGGCLYIMNLPSAAGFSQIIFISFWILFSVVKELALQIEREFVGYWIEFFLF